MEPIAPLVALVDALGRLGPGPAVLAGCIVGLTLGLILIARFGNLWGAVKAGRAAGDLQAELIAFVQASRATEDALRRRLDDAERERTLDRREIEEQRAQVAMLRHQRRRLITMMRGVVGRLPEPPIRRALPAPRPEEAT